jgi:hypothetical protein
MNNVHNLTVTDRVLDQHSHLYDLNILISWTVCTFLQYFNSVACLSTGCKEDIEVVAIIFQWDAHFA